MIGTYVSDLFVEEIYIFCLQVNRIEKVKSRNRWRTSLRLRQFEKFFLSFHIPMGMIEMVKSLWLNPLEWSWGSYPLPFLSCSLPPSSLPSSFLPLYLLPLYLLPSFISISPRFTFLIIHCFSSWSNFSFIFHSRSNWRRTTRRCRKSNWTTFCDA